MRRSEPPDEQGEGHEAHASSRGAGSIETGSHAATLTSIESRLLFFLGLMFIDQSRAGGQDCREGEEQPANPGTKLPGDNSCGGGDEPTE